MRRQVFDEELVLNCDCQEPRCLVWIGFDSDQKWGPQLFFDFEYCDIKFWSRIKQAWRLLRTGSETRRADVILVGFDNVRELKAFFDKCLSREAK